MSKIKLELDPINEARHQKGMTLAQLADMVGITLSFMNNVANGKYDISFIKMCNICEILELDPIMVSHWLTKKLQEIETIEITRVKVKKVPVKKKK